MITTVSCGLLPQLTRKLVNLSTRQLPYHKVQSSMLKVQSSKVKGKRGMDL